VCCTRTYDVSCTHYQILEGRCPRLLSGLDPGRHHASRYHGVHALPRDPVPPQPVTMHTQRTMEKCLSEYTRPSRNRSEALLIMGFIARGRTAQCCQPRDNSWTDRARPPARSPERTRDSRRDHTRDREPRCTRTARSSVTGGGGDARALAT